MNEQVLLSIYHEVGVSFIFEIHGRITLDVLKMIEEHIWENWDDKPHGTYQVVAAYVSKEKDECGRTMAPVYWDFDVIEFEPLPEEDPT